MYVEIIFKISIKLVERRVKQHSQMVNFYKWDMHFFCFRQKDNLMFQIERHFFFVSDRKTLFLFQTERHFFVSDRKTPQHVVCNRLLRRNFFSKQLFKFFFRQFSSILFLVNMFQVSLRLVERLWRYGWNKVRQK